MNNALIPQEFHPLMESAAETLLKRALHQADDGELFAESCWSESLRFDDNVLKEASFHQKSGLGLRALYGPCSVYAHTPKLSHEGLQDALSILSNLPVDASEQTSASLEAPVKSAPSPMLDSNDTALSNKTKALKEMNVFARALDPRVIQASFSISLKHQDVLIKRPENAVMFEKRLFSTFVTVITVEENGRREMGHVSIGARTHNGHLFFKRSFWEGHIKEALRRALLMLKAVPAPAGTMPVLLGRGITGILLHEAVGHGLEADFNRKGHSVFANKMGKMVSHPEVTVIDEGRWDMNLENGHGCLERDDEGTPTQKTVLIQEGKMVGHISDRLNARLMGKTSSGNGRRQSYAHQPMPRMTNTYMLKGTASFQDLAADIKRGIYAVGFSGGQVDIVSGSFVFASSEAYLIENGRIGPPIKGATLIGNGLDTMQKIKGVGNDLLLDPGVGYCGKEGQTAIVGLGQPSCLISGMTVGGTQVG